MSQHLDLTFAALADPTRRAMLDALCLTGDVAVGELARPFRMTLPAVLKHVNVLSEAGLLVREKRGRTVFCRLRAGPMQDAQKWIERYEAFWSERLDALANYVEEQPCPKPASPKSTSQVSPSNATSKRRSSACSKPGRTGRR